MIASWQQLDKYEYEYDENGYTGWYRVFMGYPIPINVAWFEWNYKTQAIRKRTN
jgi:hypothetical protein